MCPGRFLSSKLLAKASQKRLCTIKFLCIWCASPWSKWYKSQVGCGRGVRDGFCPGHFHTTGAGGILCILCHTVTKHGYQVCIVAHESVFAPQDTLESAKTTFTITKDAFHFACICKVFPPVRYHDTERDAPSPLDKTLLHLPFTPVPAYTSPCT